MEMSNETNTIMKVLFGSENLEKLSSKFIIQLSGFLHDKDLHDISVNSCIQENRDDLNQITSIWITHRSNIQFDIVVKHAVNMSCSNWEIKKR